MNGFSPSAWRGRHLPLLGLMGLLVVAAMMVACGGCRATRSEISSQAEEARGRSRGEVHQQRQVESDLVHYGQVALIPTGLSEPRGIALTGNGEQLAVVGDRLLVKLGTDGSRDVPIALEAEPVCVAAAREQTPGKLWVGFKRRVQLYSEEGRVLAGWDIPGKNAYVTCLAAIDDYLFIADAGNRVVWHYSKSGQLQGRIGDALDGDGHPRGLVAPGPYLEVVVTQNRDLLVTNPGHRRIETYSISGELKSHWGRASQDLDGFCGCCNPVHIALLADGRVVTSEKGLPRVKVYSTQGVLESVVATPDDLSVSAAGLDLAVDEAGRVYVLDPPARAVRVFEMQQAETSGE